MLTESDNHASFDPEAVAQLGANIQAQANAVILDAHAPVRLAVCALLAGGHVLMQADPGVGKTSLAKVLANSIEGSFRRVQGGADLLPSDIVGITMYRPNDGEWVTKPGPIFANVVLLDEVGQLTPRAQAALLEAMAERQVTLDGVLVELPSPHWVLATQNPVGQSGGFSLVPPVLDRFAIAISLGYPSAESEAALVQRRPSPAGAAISNSGPACSAQDVALAITSVRAVHVSAPVAAYVAQLCAATRHHPQLSAGVSPRASVIVGTMARAHAALAGRGGVTPDDVQAVAVATLAHRVNCVEGDATQVIEQLLSETAVPTLLNQRRRFNVRGAWWLRTGT